MAQHQSHARFCLTKFSPFRTMSLKSFHVVLIAFAIVLTAGVGTWGLFNHYRVVGGVSLVVSCLLVVYEAYFAAKAEQVHLDQ